MFFQWVLCFAKELYMVLRPVSLLLSSILPPLVISSGLRVLMLFVHCYVRNCVPLKLTY